MGAENDGAPLRRRYKLVVSDFHLGKGRHLPDKTQNLLEDFIYDKEFAEFLDFYRSGEFRDVDVELVLNGDILNLLQMDTWGVHTHLITERSVLRAIERIVKGHPDFFDALRRFASTPGHTISYVIGNHDCGMLWPRAQKAFSAAIGTDVAFFPEHYLFDGIYVEHGQQHENFAKIDMNKQFITRNLPEPVLNLPWGSIFTAVLLPSIKRERPHVDKVRPISIFTRWVLLHEFWWGVKTVGRILKFIFETMNFQRRHRTFQTLGQTLKVLKEISVYPNFDKIAFRILADREEVNAVIFGHTHIIRYRQWREGKEYFNIGTWNETTNLYLDDYGRRVRLSYAFIEYPAPGAAVPSATLRPKILLKEWRGLWRPDIDILA